MGKIFDALEKASKQSRSTAKLSLNKNGGAKGNKAKIQQTAKTNVVPFASPSQRNAENNYDPNLVTFHNPNSVEAEIFKVLRTSLLFPSEGKPPKTILVTSAIPGDGKSFVSANLAISIAQGVENHVLLVDSDIRNPSIDQMFGMGNVAGLTEYLAKGTNVADNFVKTALDKLTILPAGQSPYNPTELLTTQKMKALLEEVSKRYEDRFVVVDSAPPSLASETIAIANYVDGIIIVVKARKTPKKAVMEVIEQMGKEKILGIVLNFSDQSANRYYGYGKSYYRKK